MKKLLIAAVAVVLGLFVLAVFGVLGARVIKQHVAPAMAREKEFKDAINAEPAPAAPLPAAALETRPAGDADRGFLFGRVTTMDGTTYQGRLRFGGSEEAFWGDYFNGVKHENPWMAQLTPEQVPRESHSVELFGWKLAEHSRERDVTRQLTARFGEITKIEARGKQVQVTLKSGSVVDVNRFDASDFDDGVTVWDLARGATELDSMKIHTIELLPTTALAAPPARVYGTVRSRQGDFTGFIEWNREKCLGSDELEGRDENGTTEHHLRFDTIRSIEQQGRNDSLVTLTDGKQLKLNGRLDVEEGNRGIVVDDPRFGRVVVSWYAFQRADFTPAASGPGYEDFPAGSKLSGSVTTKEGKRFAGRLVYDLDESETTETLDGSFEGIDYSIPFGMIASIAPSEDHPTRVKLHNGVELQLEWDGDVGDQNAGELVFVEGAKPEYVPWADVSRIDLDRPKAMYPPLEGR